MNLADFRQQYPQYGDIPDETLAKSLHEKFYSDMPFDQFSNNIGLRASVPDLTTKVGPADFAGGVAETIAGPVAQFVTAPVALASGVAEATKPVAGSRIAGTLLNYFTNRLGEKFVQGGERITKPVGEFMAPETQTGKVLSEKLSQVFDYLPEKAGEATYQATESPALATAAKTGAYGLELIAPFFRRAKAAEVAQTEAKPSGPSTVAADMQKVRPVTEAVDQSLKAAQASRETTGAKPTAMESAFKQANSIDKTGVSVEAVPNISLDVSRETKKTPVIQPEKVDAGQVSTVEIKPNAALDPEAKAIETKFAQEIMAAPEAAKQRYIQANTNEHGTLVINTDQARELSPDYNASIETRSKNANAVHEPASAIVKAIYADALKKSPQEGHDPLVIFTSGGTGAGKTSALTKLHGLAEQTKRAQIIYDTNMNTFESAKSKIDQALSSGKQVIVNYVHRDPMDAMVSTIGGTLKRAEKVGRTVPISAHAETHIGAAKDVPKLVENYKNNPDVHINIIDNRMKGAARLANLDVLKETDYTNLEQRLHNEVDRLYAAGQVSERVYNGTKGSGAGARSENRPGVDGQPESQRLPGAGPAEAQPESAAQLLPGGTTGEPPQNISVAVGRGVDTGVERPRVAFQQAGAEDFHAAITQAKAKNRFGSSVAVYPKEEYANMRTFLAHDKSSGFALKGDDLVSVFSDGTHPGVGSQILDQAIAAGAKRLDAFDTVLPGLYSTKGFRAVARVKWNDEYAPPDWDKTAYQKFNNGNPDVVFMVHDPESKALYKPGDGQTVSSYEEGMKLQTEALQGKKAEVIPIRPPQKEPFPTSDQRKVVGLGIGIKPELKPIVEELGKRIQETKIGRASTDLMKAGISDVQKGFAPMAEGSPRARAVVKDWANADRLARWQWGQFDELLKKNYTEEELGAMWRAADEENVLRTKGTKQTGAGGIDALPADQRAVVETLHQYGEELLQRAKAVEMFKGEGLPYWAPRMAVIIGEDGEIIRPKGGAEGGTVGRNVTTSAPSLKHRKYLTKEDTEKAMKEKFGEGAKVVQNIRTMPMAMSRLERAIAGRELINNIREIGKQAGEELISESDKPGFFTLDHPSFKTYRPRLSRVADVNVETNKFEVVKDANGDIVFDKVPLWVAKEFEGPLKSVMSENSGAIYRGLMALKGKTMSVIMYSPIIHNAVEYGRALPASPGKMLSFRMYRDGGAAMRDPELMRQAITDGMVPIGHRYAFQDISGLMEEPTLKEGRSTTAKVAGAVADVVSKEAGNKVRTAIDKAGDVWHNKLLWDQVAKLQAGLYVNIKANFKSKLIEGGLDADKAEAVAGKVAAHFANRYAGAIPNEAMSQWSRKMANMVMFSRSFTVGNIGAMKDAMIGLPRDVQAHIMRDVGKLEGAQALKSVSVDVKSMARRKAIGIIMMDIAFGIAGNSILQDTLDHLKRDKSLDQIGQGYADRLDALVQRGKESPLEVLNPIGDLEALSSTSENEPGKENRVLWGYDDKGTAIYVRLPTGKIGEEFSGYIDLFTGKADILLRKESTVLRPLQQAILNDVGFGRHLYDPDAKGVKASMQRMGAIVWNFAAQQTPQESIKGAARLVQGKGNDVDFYKVVGPFFGLTFSKGAPGGPAVGLMFKVSRQHSNEIVNAMPDVKQLIEDGDQAAAIDKMKEAHMTPQEIRTTLKYAANPGARISPRKMRQFQQTAPEEEKNRMQKLQGQ